MYWTWLMLLCGRFDLCSACGQPDDPPRPLVPVGPRPSTFNGDAQGTGDPRPVDRDPGPQAWGAQPWDPDSDRAHEPFGYGWLRQGGGSLTPAHAGSMLPPTGR